MAALKPVYLIHGDDHGRIAERRAGLRALADREGDSASLEVLEGEAATPGAVVGTLTAMTFAMGRRFVIVDGVERWKDSEVEPVAAALPGPADELTVAFFAREEGRWKVPAPLVKAVEAAGGDVRAESSVKPWELPKWVAARAREQGLELGPGAARALVVQVGDRQQRLLRELEKLALALPPGATIEIETVQELAAGGASRKAWDLGDALTAGDAARALRLYLELRVQGERLPGLVFTMVRRLREGHDARARIDAGEAPAQVKRSLRMPPKAADRFLADLEDTDGPALREAIATIADLELASRGGGRGVRGEDAATTRAFAELVRD